MLGVMECVFVCEASVRAIVCWMSVYFPFYVMSEVRFAVGFCAIGCEGVLERFEVWYVQCFVRECDVFWLGVDGLSWYVGAYVDPAESYGLGFFSYCVVGDLFCYALCSWQV